MHELSFLVYGWYGRRNTGDELMRAALQHLFEPKGVNLRFVDKITADNLGDVDGVLFGGGSILYDDPQLEPEAFDALLIKQPPVFYLGVGGETDISPVHQRLIDVSPVVAFRELDVPDLVYSFASTVRPKDSRPDQGVVVVPNVEVIPTYEDPHWAHVAWEHFKNEMAQFLDRMVDRGHKISFLLMCHNDRQDDVWPAHELIARMKRRENNFTFHSGQQLGLDAVYLMRAHRIVVTQRYHGIVLSELAGVPYVSIDHHKKLVMAWPARGKHISYHGIQKDTLTDIVENVSMTDIVPYSPPAATYNDIVERIIEEGIRGKQVRRI